MLGAYPVGPWYFNNYEGLEWPNTSTAIIAVESLFNSTTPYTVIMPSEVVPFFHVTLHVKSAQSSQINSFGIVLPVAGYGPEDGYGLTLFSTMGYNITAIEWVYAGGRIHEIPEPASMTLLGGGLAALVGGWVRRKRRA